MTKSTRSTSCRLAFIVGLVTWGLPGCGPPEPAQPMSPAVSGVMTRETREGIRPEAALERLKEGNGRFVTGRSRRHDYPSEIQATASGQYPFAAVVCCLDSRVPPELVFDQGLGDIFTVRVAGNVLNDDILGSLEFATRVAGAKLIVVVGHSSCGAVKGACSNVELGHLTGLLNKIKPAVETIRSGPSTESDGKNEAFIDDVARENVRRMVRLLREQSPILRELAGQGALKLVGGFQDLSSGRVVFLD